MLELLRREEGSREFRLGSPRHYSDSGAERTFVWGCFVFRLLSPPRVFRHRAGGLPNSSPSAKGSRYRRQNPCEDYRPPTSAEGAGRRQYPCNEGRSAENPGWSLSGSITGRAPRRVSVLRVPKFLASCRSSPRVGSSLSLHIHVISPVVVHAVHPTDFSSAQGPSPSGVALRVFYN